MELARQVTWFDEEAELFHYRTRDQVEVDAVLKNRRGEVVGIEVKAASAVGPTTLAVSATLRNDSATTSSQASCCTPDSRKCWPCRSACWPWPYSRSLWAIGA
ncbi:hypothetical protein B0T46_17225 [Nocardia donostiensis]|uniref:DUF4143 domain-containing protein n=2 Tax=Nocardia donostiensis TaxID=1538463 RepID=A0A1V2TDP6_9NOCA|nr:hypothetical protein B0T46_17225 [Nocardia donostiensis]